MAYKEIIAWNTGRQYSEYGQRVAVGLTEHNDVHFADTDRCIDGVLKYRWPLPSPSNENQMELFQDWFMEQYDRCKYAGTAYDSTLHHCASEVK